MESEAAQADAQNALTEAGMEVRQLQEQYDDLEAELQSLYRRRSNIPRQILEMRFGLNGENQTLEEVGKKLKVTRERVRQIEERAIRKLRHPQASRILKDYLD